MILLQFRQQKHEKIALTLNGKLWYLLDKKLDVGNRNDSHGTLSIITKNLLAKKLMPKNEKEDYSYEKDQEGSCCENIKD